MLPDHYQALGVHPQASQAEIRAAYLRVMRASHPDRRPGDRHAAERARTANAAWHTLKDSARRASYDRLHVRNADGSVGHTVRRVEAPVVAHPAYSDEKTRVARQFHFAAVRLGVTVFVVGWILLLLAL